MGYAYYHRMPRANPLKGGDAKPPIYGSEGLRPRGYLTLLLFESFMRRLEEARVEIPDHHPENAYERQRRVCGFR